MGVVITRMTRPLRAWNIDNRAEKIINKEKPVAAPRRASTEAQLKLAQEVNPDFMANHYKKDEELLNRLKQVFVSSNIQQGEDNKSEKPMPNRRTATDAWEYGYWEPSEIPEGRCQLRQALLFMSDHMTHPEKHTVDSIALKYKLDTRDVANILEYYRVFQVIIPEEGEEKLHVPKHEMKGAIEDK